MRRAEPIADVVANPSTTPELRQRLQRILQIRRFAIDELKLPDNGSYLHYADLQRPYVVWNVFATPEFSLKPVQSCFPIVGCLSYRGYFIEAEADKAAAQLAAAGNDVFVGGVAAYSTLGWFEDPIVSSMLRWDETRLAKLIFHEMAHQQVYANNDSDFNEAFATAVGEIGGRRWLAANKLPDQHEAWLQSQARQEDFLALVKKTAKRLEDLYQLQADADAMRAAKAEVMQSMREQYRQLRDGPWDGYDGYDDWFAKANNARIAAISTYHDQVPSFIALYEALGQDIQAFYRACERAANMSPKERQAWQQRYTQAARAE